MWFRTITPFAVAAAAVALMGQARIDAVQGTMFSARITLTCLLSHTGSGLRVRLHNPTSNTIPAGRFVEWRLNTGERGNIRLPHDLHPDRQYSPMVYYGAGNSCSAAATSGSGLAQ